MISVFSAALSATPSVRCQIVELDCCITDEHFQKIGLCISGPGVWDVSDACDAKALCVAGFGENPALADSLCMGKPDVIPVFDRAVCTRWSSGEPPTTRCEAAGAEGVSLHALLDSDDDGDLDLRDFAAFQQIRDFVPSLDQSQAVVANVDCCTGESAARRLGDCVSGPAISQPPPHCGAAVACEIAFTEPVQEGDFAHLLCDAGAPGIPDDEPAVCHAWPEPQLPVPDFCSALPPFGLTTFTVFDADGDGDLDLADYANFQSTLIQN